MNGLLKLSGLLDYVEKIGMYIAAFALFTLATLTTIDIIIRRVMGKGITGLFELTQDYFMVAIIFCGLSYVYVKGGHVRITLFEKYLPQIIKPLLTKILDLAALVFWALVTVKSFEVAQTAFMSNELSIGILSYIMWPSYMFVPIGTGLLTLRVLQKIIFPQSIQTDSEELTDEQMLMG